MKHTCSACPATWTGLATAHCGACHRTFARVSGFDLHRARGACTGPATMRRRDGRPVLVDRDGVWHRAADGMAPSHWAHRRARGAETGVSGG